MSSPKKKAASGARSAFLNKSDPWHEFWGIVLLFSGIFLCLALLSYNHGDPSIFTQTRRLPSNYGGRVGANLAEGLLQLVGFSAFFFAGLILASSVRLFKKYPLQRHLAHLFWHTVAILTSAVLFGLVLGSVRFGGAPLHCGGLLGAWLAPRLVHYLNLWGAILLSMCALLIAIVFSTPLSMALLWKVVKPLAAQLLKGARALFTHAPRLVARVHWAAAEKRKTEKLIESKFKTPAIGAPEIVAEKPAAPKIAAPAPELATAGLNLLDDADGIPVETLEMTPPSVIAKRVASQQRSARQAGNHAGVEPLSANTSFRLPLLDMLNEPGQKKSELDRNRLIENSKILETKLDDFGIEGAVVAVRPGPVITMYEFKPGPGVKISQIAALADDLSLALSAQSVRIVAPIPGKSVVGIEIPNEERERVYLREILSTSEFQGSDQGIPLAIGKDISGAPVVADLARMPHLLIAGAPGAGKSVFINSLICSLLYKFTPNDMRLIMVDPKQLELNLYEDIPHLLLPVVDDPKKASTALKWATNEMERRYKIMAKSGIRNIAGFNQKFEREGEEKMRALLCPEDSSGMPEPTSLAHLFDHDEKGKPRIERMPAILVIIDEFADLMMVAPKDIETSVARLAQKARAAGIHLVIATQRPSVDVITGLIKANLPSRISFQVASKVDSRTILDSIGAEKLLGQGDMLFIPPGLSRLTRIHGAFVNEEEIEKLCDHWRSQAAPVYKEEILIEPEEAGGETADGAGDELYGQAIAIVRELGQASASMLQRRLKVGYNRAARMVEAMEAQGIVGPQDGARPREVIY